MVKACSMLKLKTCDLVNKVVYDCLQMFGGYGFMAVVSLVNSMMADVADEFELQTGN